MTLVDFLLLLLVAGLCGAVGRAVGGGTRGGFLVSIGVGLVGALVGRWVAVAAGLPEVLAVNVGGTTFPIVWAILGSALFVAILNLVTWRRIAS